MSRTRSLLIGLLALTAALALAAYWLTAASGDPDLRTSVSVSEALASDTAGYRRATRVRNFTFPADHGPHPGYKTEWWYVTGTLRGPETQPYGYELTIFRLALTPPDAAPDSTVESDWRTNQLYMAHFTVTDGAQDEFHAFERFERGGADLAGARATPFRVWLDDGRDLMYYQLRQTDGSPSPFSEDVLVDPDSSTRLLDRDDVETEVLDTWTTPDGTRTYPVEWRLRVPGEGLDLQITPYFPNQELDVSVRYWEGAVQVLGSASGRGYLEMTGYGDSPASPVF